ncbi:phosphatase PAP2 family protein [Loigolactobacillus jiayinensis]|uniref:Phosphatase PAP2 family protein n=1 Tax=Loigolactobacillus jiayinensis TaxID=2486016 RepID=A0ABW1RHD2_9LACO|nr:phosphatase PAP2 family protein [Loigolactobacillus jiayinensis]
MSTKLFRRRLLFRSLGAYIVFAFLTYLVWQQRPWLTQIDQQVNNWLTCLRTPWLDHIIIAITNFGNPGNSMLLTAVLLILLLSFQQRQLALFSLFNVALIGGLGNHLLKLLVMRPRPTAVAHLVHAGGTSFPSGHAAGSMAFFGALIVITYYLVAKHQQRQVLTSLWLLFILLIGLSRIYVGVHNTSDVLAGWAWGLGGLSLSWWLFIRSGLLPQKNYFSKPNQLPR